MDRVRDDEPAGAMPSLTGIGEYLRRQLRGAVRGFHDRGEQLGIPVRAWHPVLQQAGRAHDSGEQVIKIVRDTSGEHSQALELLGLEELRFELLALGEIQN